MSTTRPPQIEVFAIDSIEQLASCLPQRSKYFTLLLAWDGPDIEDEKLIGLFQPLVERGLAYFCAWGKRCEIVHDAVDECVVSKELEEDPADYLLMTTWHSAEPLEEALWFFSINAIPSEEIVLADYARYAVAVCNPEWACEMLKLTAL